jgi:uncharacterized phage protein gp47/JayE
MLFKKGYGELVHTALSYLETNTDITNTNIGGITRSLIEVINRNVADYYDVLDINMAMSFLSTAEGYFLDMFGEMFNMPRTRSAKATASSVDNVQRFYVTSGTLGDKIPGLQIVAGTAVMTSDRSILFRTTSTVSFAGSATQVYVSIESDDTGSKYNVGKNSLTVTDLGIDGVFTVNDVPIISGTDTESDANYRYRLSNATLASEKANEIAIRLAALSVDGVADVIIRKYARGIGSYDVMVIPAEGVATQALISAVQSAIEEVQAAGIKGTAIAPTIVPVNLEVKLMFTSNATDAEKETIRANVRTEIEYYIVNIPIGGTFIVNELRQRIMDVSPKIKDHMITCYYFREQPHFLKNVDIYWDEMFYPNPDTPEAIKVI